MYTLDNLLWENKMAFGVRKTDIDIPAGTDFYACPLCEAVFTSKQEYKQHLKTHNANIGKPPA
jgi:uncharacterized C2H2 Zn-finger protein